MITSIVESIQAVPAAEWEHLARPAGLYLSHRWLAGEEEDPTATSTYALVRDLGAPCSPPPPCIWCGTNRTTATGRITYCPRTCGPA